MPEIDPERLVTFQVSNAQRAVVDRHIDDKRTNTQAVCCALFCVFIEMLRQDNMRVHFLENGTSEVEVRGIDYD